MKKAVLVFIFDGYADWESAYVSSELNAPETGYAIKTLSLDKEPKTSMGGFRVLPDYSVADFPAALREAFRVLKTGGRLVVDSPAVITPGGGSTLKKHAGIIIAYLTMLGFTPWTNYWRPCQVGGCGVRLFCLYHLILTSGRRRKLWPQKLPQYVLAGLTGDSYVPFRLSNQIGWFRNLLYVGLILQNYRWCFSHYTDSNACTWDVQECAFRHVVL